VTDQPAPIEVVEVVPDMTVNQSIAAGVVVFTTYFVGPIALRALLRNFNIEMGYWKAVRTIFAGRLVVLSLTTNNFTPPAGRGATLKAIMEAKKLVRSKT
jgi:hypothetical protein